MAKETKVTLEVGSPEWIAAKREAKKALDERLGTARKVLKREDQRG